MSASGSLLALAEVSDSINSLTPRLRVFTVHERIISLSQTVVGSCFSLGKSISPTNLGFVASSPASAFRWGSPGPLLTRISPANSETQQLPFPLIPYGESMSSSYLGQKVILCSPFSSQSCVIVSSNTTSVINAPEGIRSFGISVAMSPNGSQLAFVSQGVDNMAVISFLSVDGSVISSFSIPHSPLISCRSQQPFAKFLSEKRFVVFFYGLSKFLIYQSTVNGWILDRTVNIEASSVTSSGGLYFILSENGRCQLFDKDFNQKGEEVIPRTLVRSNFTAVVAGSNWLSVLEESDEKRRLHIYSTARDPIYRGIFFFVITAGLTLIVIFARPFVDPRRLLSFLHRPRQSKRL